MLRDTGFDINRSNRGKRYDGKKLRIGISTFTIYTSLMNAVL
jgi:hypothetical protein